MQAARDRIVRAALDRIVRAALDRTFRAARDSCLIEYLDRNPNNAVMQRFSVGFT